MRCPNCDKEIPEGKKFCGFCGTRLLPVDEEASPTVMPHDEAPDFNEEAQTTKAPELEEEQGFSEDGTTRVFQQSSAVAAVPPGEADTVHTAAEPARQAPAVTAHAVGTEAAEKGIQAIWLAGGGGMLVVVGLGIVAVILTVIAFFNRGGAGLFSDPQPTSIPPVNEQLVVVIEVTATTEPTHKPTGTSPPNDKPTSTRKPTHTAQPTPLPILFSEDFSNPDPDDWWTGEDTVRKNSFYSGGYRIKMLKENWYTSSYMNINTSDVVIEVDVKNLGIDNNDMGVICRRVDSNNFYVLEIASDGNYQIRKLVNGEGEDMVDWRRTDVINTGKKTNHILAICEGNQLSLYVNGQFIDQVTDNDLSTGKFGIFAGSLDDPGVDMLFDNFLAYKP